MHRILTVIIPQLWYRPPTPEFPCTNTHSTHFTHSTHTPHRERRPKSQVLRFSEREREMIERGGQGRQRERHDTGLCREKGQVWEDIDRADLRPRTIIRLIRVRCCTVRALPQRGEERGQGESQRDTIRRGEAGVESNHTWRGRPLPAQNHKSRRDRERNDRETGERGDRRERGDTPLCRENGQVWEGPRSCGPQTTHHHMIF